MYFEFTFARAVCWLPPDVLIECDNYSEQPSSLHVILRIESIIFACYFDPMWPLFYSYPIYSYIEGSNFQHDKIKGNPGIKICEINVIHSVSNYSQVAFSNICDYKFLRFILIHRKLMAEINYPYVTGIIIVNASLCDNSIFNSYSYMTLAITKQ